MMQFPEKLKVILSGSSTTKFENEIPFHIPAVVELPRELKLNLSGSSTTKLEN